MPSFITAKGLEALDNYKYVSGGYSPFDNFVNPFWEFCVTLLPLVRGLAAACAPCGHVVVTVCGHAVARAEPRDRHRHPRVRVSPHRGRLVRHQPG